MADLKRPRTFHVFNYLPGRLSSATDQIEEVGRLEQRLMAHGADLVAEARSRALTSPLSYLDILQQEVAARELIGGQFRQQYMGEWKLRESSYQVDSMKYARQRFRPIELVTKSAESAIGIAKVMPAGEVLELAERMMLAWGEIFERAQKELKR